MEHKHIISGIVPDSAVSALPIRPGDALVQLNHEPIEDIFDYQYQSEERKVVLTIGHQDGSVKEYTVCKDEDDDLGLIFQNGFMDDYKSCCNRCIFCFIDQMPPGMRDTLYFKDDDARLSFLQGNYVTLTNMQEKDVERILRYRLSPINISFHTTNPELRCRMLNNRFAGSSLAIVDRFYEAGITMNGQIVLCRGINDGKELERTISDLTRYLPHLKSVSVVPVGLTRFRDGLFPLEPFDREEARKVLSLIHLEQKRIYEEYGTHFIHASDEFYLLAEEELPPAEQYDQYPQLENGVGMLRLFRDEFEEAMQHLKKKKLTGKHHVSVATGMLAYPTVNELCHSLMAAFPKLTVSVYPIRNDFFGERITVTGLLTGQDVIAQLKDKDLGEKLFLPVSLLRSGTDILLDDVHISDIESTLQVKTDIVKSSGWDFVHSICGDYLHE